MRGGVPGGVDPLLSGGALRCADEAGEVAADIGLDEAREAMDELGVVVLAAFAGTVEEEDERVGLDRKSVV